MSNSVVPAAAVAHAKQLVKNKKLTKRTEDQKPAQDEQQAADHKADAANAVQVERADHAQGSMSATSMSGDFSFGGALSAAADSSASLVAESAQDDGGSVGDDGDGAGGTILLVGAVGLAGLGVAVLAGGGGKSNEAPDITSGSTAAVAENAPVTTVVYTTVATDPDGDSLTYSLSGSDAAAFDISSTGVVTLKASADFETKSSYSFNVVVSDGDLTDTQAVTVTVGNVAGEAPVFTSGTTASIAENSPIATVVYDANVTGANATFALTGADAAAFSINPTTGEVTFKASPDYEAETTYTIGIIATQDGGTSTQNVTISVTDVVEPGPTFTSATASLAIDENVPTSTVVYDADATGTGEITYSLTGADAGFFSINEETGVVTFKASPDFEADPSYTLTVRATDENGSTDLTLDVTINDLPETGPLQKSLDELPGMTSTASVTVTADEGAFEFLDDSSKTSNVVITGFSADDVIEVSGILNPSVYSYTNAGGGDLRIDYQDEVTNAVTSILITDVLGLNDAVFGYNSAVAAVGHDFLVIA